MPEGVALPVGSDHQQVVLHGLAQRGEQLVLAESRDLGEQPVRHGPARHRGGAQQLLRVGSERVHPAEQHVRQRRRQVRRVAIGLDRAGQLLDQVGVAAGAVEDGLGDGRPGGLAEDRVQLGAYLIPVESPQVDPVDRPVALPAGQQRAQRVPPVQFVRPVGDHDQDPRVAQRPDQERGQVEGGPVGPVHVLDREQDGRDAAQPAERAEHELEQLRLLHVLTGRGGESAARRAAGRERREFRQQPGQPGRGGAEHPGEHVGGHGPGQRAERVHQRRQRQAFGPQLHALPGQHAEPFPRRPRAQLPGQPGLAHARLAADQRERRVPCLRAVKEPFQRPHLVLPADEDRTDHIRAHGVNGPTDTPGQTMSVALRGWIIVSGP